jgi:hypothetical protein
MKKNEYCRLKIEYLRYSVNLIKNDKAKRYKKSAIQNIEIPQQAD